MKNEITSIRAWAMSVNRGIAIPAHAGRAACMETAQQSIAVRDPWEEYIGRDALPPAIKQVAVLFLILLVILIMILGRWRVRLGSRLGLRRACRPFDCRFNICSNQNRQTFGH